MDDRRRPKWDKFTGPSRGRPSRGSWQPAIPSWEKQFCRVIGSIEWETLLQKKKFIHLYANVVNWDDSAGKEAFFHAKERFWAELNGISCETPLPDPDFYIDEINWDTELNLDEFEYMPCVPDEHHEPVVIFGNGLLPSVGYSGWGDQEDEKLKTPAGSNNATDTQHPTPVGHLNKNHERVPVSTDYRVAFDGETRRKQRYGNQFTRWHHQIEATYGGQHHSTDKRADQRV